MAQHKPMGASLRPPANPPVLPGEQNPRPFALLPDAAEQLPWTSLGTCRGQGGCCTQERPCQAARWITARCKSHWPTTSRIFFFFFKEVFPLKAWCSHSQAEAKEVLESAPVLSSPWVQGEVGTSRDLTGVPALPSPAHRWIGARRQAAGAGAALFTQPCVFPSTDMSSSSSSAFHTHLNATALGLGTAGRGVGGQPTVRSPALWGNAGHLSCHGTHLDKQMPTSPGHQPLPRSWQVESHQACLDRAPQPSSAIRQTKTFPFTQSVKWEFEYPQMLVLAECPQAARGPEYKRQLPSPAPQCSELPRAGPVGGGGTGLQTRLHRTHPAQHNAQLLQRGPTAFTASTGPCFSEDQSCWKRC